MNRGATEENYSWDQTLQDATIEITFDEPVHPKTISCVVKRNHVTIGIKGSEPLVDGDLFSNVDVDESCWSLEDRKLFTLSLVKLDTTQWWPYIVKGGKELDVTEIAPEESRLQDLDPEMRATVEKMMYEQRQKGAAKTEQEQRFDQFKAQHPDMDFSGAKVNFGE